VHIRLLCIGRIKTQATRALINDFSQRLRAYHVIDEIELRAAAGDDPQRAIANDTAQALARIDAADRVWLLDREGQQWSSENLSEKFSQEEHQAKGRMIVVIGGAYGFDERMQQRANVRWSLSQLTFLHEWARAIVVEQIYRATKILRNEPYHH
jgi:23S rRNA (pseudouridine1915-N3)-methyltransferase